MNVVKLFALLCLVALVLVVILSLPPVHVLTVATGILLVISILALFLIGKELIV